MLAQEIGVGIELSERRTFTVIIFNVISALKATKLIWLQKKKRDP